MPKRETEIIKNLIIKSLEKKKVSINKIVLFGSYLKSSFNKDSDIDIIIVSNDFRGKDIFERVELLSGLHREFVKTIKRPLDIMYYSDEEWDEGHSLIINSAKINGELIFS